jgi:hypothetical protein
MASLALVPAYLLIVFAVTFAALAAAALLLMFVFLCALPLGFFEFGAPILAGIGRQYGYVFVLSLVSVILPAVLLSTGTLVFSGPPTLENMVMYLPILLIVTIAGSYIAKMSVSALQGTFNVVTSSLRAGVGAYSAYGQVPQAAGESASLAKIGGLAALAAVTGGVGLAAAGGAVLSKLKSSETPEQGRVTSKEGHVFKTKAGRAAVESRHRAAVGELSGSRYQLSSLEENDPGPVAGTRPTGQMWEDEDAPRELARRVLQEPAAMGSDSSAAVSLQGLAEEMSLDENSLEQVFMAVRDATRDGMVEAGGSRDGGSSVDNVKEKISAVPRIGQQPAPSVSEMARLAVLVANASQMNTSQMNASQMNVSNMNRTNFNRTTSQPPVNTGGQK